MGLCLTAKYPGAPAYYMGYSNFYRLRCFLASCFSSEFGSHYSRIMQVNDGEETEEYNAATERMLKKLRAKSRAVELLFLPDADGRLSPSKCRALLEAIGDNNTNEKFGYAAYPDKCMSIAQLKALLQACAEKKAYLVWH